MDFYYDPSTDSLSPLPPEDSTRPVLSKTIALPTTRAAVLDALGLMAQLNPSITGTLDKTPVVKVTFAAP